MAHFILRASTSVAASPGPFPNDHIHSQSEQTHHSHTHTPTPFRFPSLIPTTFDATHTPTATATHLSIPPNLPHPQPHPPPSTPPSNLLQRFSNLLSGMTNNGMISNKSSDGVLATIQEDDNEEVITHEPPQPTEDNDDDDNTQDTATASTPSSPLSTTSSAQDSHNNEVQEPLLEDVRLDDSPDRRVVSARRDTLPIEASIRLVGKESDIAVQLAQQVLNEDTHQHQLQHEHEHQLQLQHQHPSEDDPAMAAMDVSAEALVAFSKHQHDTDEVDDDERSYVDHLIHQHPQEREMRLHFLRQAFVALFTAQDMVQVQHLGRVMCSILGVRCEEEAAIMDTIDKISPAIVATFAIESLTHQLAQFFT